MIKSLSIRNYALIEFLDFNPSSNLSIVTGETGAGKSIMLGALGLLLGKRADTKVLWDESTKCTVEGVFQLEDYDLKSVFKSLGLDYDNESIIRREIIPSGKSRAFINDTPVNLEALRFIGSYLMDIHSQHESLQLGSNDYQLSILDTFSQHPTLLADYRKAYDKYDASLKNLQKLHSQAKKSGEDLDYKKFIFEELQALPLEELNLEELESELKILENAEEIKRSLEESSQIFEHEEYGINQRLNEIQINLRQIQNLSANYEEISSRLSSSLLELKDIHSELDLLNDLVVHDPQKQSALKETLDEVQRLLTKHRSNNISELVSLRNNLDEELQLKDNLTAVIAKAENQVNIDHKEVMRLGGILTDARKHHGLNFSESIEKVVKEIGIENGKVEFLVQPSEIAETGLDTIEVLFSANKGISPKELKFVASGGEFSRLIFAIKFLLADKTSLPTIIFDEIDTGVSGEIAIKMIRMMKKMAKNHQVIAISHLPQFAAGGDEHFFVYKDELGDKTVTKIQLLENKERIEAIAKMIGGDNPSEMAFESAKELLSLPA